MSTALEAAERASGATFAPVAEDTSLRPLPLRFRGVESEWTAIRQHAGLLDAGFRGVLRLIGSDRATFLQGMLSNDVARLEPGQGTYAAFLTQQGKVIADLRVYVLDDEIWLDLPAPRVAAMREGLERYIVADDVELAPSDLCEPLVAIEGPAAAQTVAAVIGQPVDGLPLFGHRQATVDGHPVRVAMVSHTGEMGYLIFGEQAYGAALWERSRAAGATPVGLEGLDILRIEAGIPWYGRDMDESTLIGEVGLEQAISYTKGCYLGQEVVERVAARGQVQRKLVGLVCDGSSLPAPGAKLANAGKEVGWVTSAVWSPARQSVIALGYARRESWDAGTELQIVDADATRVAHVVALPFYSR